VQLLHNAQTILVWVISCFIAAHPSALDDAPEPMLEWDLLKQPEPDSEFDQRIAW
jgi:hypothetical protein